VGDVISIGIGVFFVLVMLFSFAMELFD